MLLQSASGHPVEYWETLTTVWGSVNYRLSISDETQAAPNTKRESAQQYVNFRIRYRTDVNERVRILYRNQYYDITAIAISPDRFYLDIEGQYNEGYEAIQSGLYTQYFAGDTDGVLTWTENGGELPAATTRLVFVFANGQKLIEGTNYTISAPTITVSTHSGTVDYYVLAVIGNVTANFYYQAYASGSGPALTWTENGGTFPVNTEAQVLVFMNGQKLIEDTNYTISGSVVTIDAATHWDGALYEIYSIIV